MAMAGSLSVSDMIPSADFAAIDTDLPDLRRHLRRQPIHLARVVGRHRRAGVTGEGLGGFDTELVTNAVGGL